MVEVQVLLILQADVRPNDILFHEGLRPILLMFVMIGIIPVCYQPIIGIIPIYYQPGYVLFDMRSTSHIYLLILLLGLI